MFNIIKLYFIFRRFKIDTLSEQIKDQLKKSFLPKHIDLIDETHHHLDHHDKDSKSKKNYTLIIESDILNNLSMLKAHQAIYACLDVFMLNDIHALSIKIRK